MTPPHDPFAAGTIQAQGKLRNGLYLKGVVIDEDGIEFRVFASRPFVADELTGLTLADNLGTAYEMEAPADLLDGHGVIAFRPAPPSGAASLQLGEPGWRGLILTTPE